MTLFGGFLKWWVSPITIDFPTKMIILGCEMGVLPFEETPICLVVCVVCFSPFLIMCFTYDRNPCHFGVSII